MSGLFLLGKGTLRLDTQESLSSTGQLGEAECGRKLSAVESMFLDCGVGEDSCESLGLQGDQTMQS